jgi:hypothetical protein
MSAWMTFVTDPSFGLPTILLAGTVVLWWALDLAEPAISVLRPTARPVAEADPVSRTLNAFRHGRFSYVLGEARARLDRASSSRFNVPASRLPRTAWGARRLAGARADEARAMRRLYQRLERLEAVSVRRERGIWMRLDFWRSHAELLRRFRLALAPLLSEVSRATVGPAGRAA